MQAEDFSKAIGDWRTGLPHSRVAVYRNTVSAALIAALRVRFPVTEQLVGAEFFAAMALAYADGHRPASPVLIAYGGGLPDFIRDFESARDVVYLSDLAQLENLWWRAYHAADAVVLQAEMLSKLDPDALGNLRFTLHPAVGLLRSEFAAGSIWQAHRGGPPLAAVKLNDPQCMIVSRPGSDAVITLVSEDRHAFVSALQSGARLAEAVEQMQAQFPDFDIATAFAGLFATGLVTGFST